ncbi:MAG: glycosyltransferase family 2 protein [Nibricoccus sp.]
MNKPLISICIAAFNAEKYLEATLRTIQSQTFKDWELIVTEDGSKDRTEDFVLDFSLKVPQNVIYNRHPANRGLPATRNTGAAAASGEWIVFLDADDLWKPEHLESLVSSSHIETSDVVFSGTVEYDDATWTKLSTHTPSNRDLADLPLALYTGQLAVKSSAAMIKREALQRFGPIAADFPLCSDTEFWLRILSQGGHLLFSGTNTCIYRQHSACLSSKTAATLIETARICEHYSEWDAIPRMVARTRTAGLYRSAGRSLLADNPADALKPLSTSLRLVPLAPKTLGLWAKAFFTQGTRSRRAPAPSRQAA